VTRQAIPKGCTPGLLQVSLTLEREGGGSAVDPNRGWFVA
jgi:hypothetical protein